MAKPGICAVKLLMLCVSEIIDHEMRVGLLNLVLFLYVRVNIMHGQ